ncbi:hypothetical protein [Flavobacterium gawalongense]|uniref:Lipoprotein n=1 Tax=Flavobacterium gawalongense TaxID=2594432 RepID=A0A553BKA5_9FLAO|nr:hypothetical protein [Flavobacterium gawalongense]TRX03974.1 hypothetical protein FNW33_02605 [Flavobacterium gawalongense]TRX07151.1 hypothetical protein FNW12_07015 [Flavobacterium gawalongense]TRX08683.1 hypothetical protein FNW11_10685 [Flavobacterium gawalongense]TRX09480.1 hypothetical protein FNW10_11440 [Flavobacterium gawalongense]TRX25451.1 hypothetical protein FNW38_11415 [Flavobacterium gawalongense]
MKKIKSTPDNIILYIFSIVFFLLSCSVVKAQVGINTITPQSTFEVNGSVGQKVTTVTSNTTLDDTYNLVVCNNGSTAITITLPTAVGITGRIYTIKRDATSTANVTLTGTIDGVANLILAKAGEAETLFSNGTEWKTSNNYNSSSSSDWNLTGNTGTTAGTNFVGTIDAKDFVLKTNNTERLRTLSAGNIGIGVPAPTASLHIKPGTASAGTAPLKLTDGPLLTTVEPGAIEYKDHTFYASTYLVRRSIMLAQDVVVTPVAVSNTTTETTIYTSTMAANYLTIGKLMNIKLYGRFSTVNTSSIYTFRVKLAGITILTIASTGQNATNRPFDIDLRSTVRSIGTSGTIISYGKTQQDNLTPNIEIGNLASIDTTLANTISITVQWSNASTSNTLTLEGGATECVDQNF